jgi:hypothetical protein
VTARQHPFSTFTVCSLQDRVFTITIDQKDTNMIKAETLIDQVRSGREDRIQILELCNGF